MRPLKILRSDGLFRYKELKKKQVIKIILALFLSLVVIGAAFFTVYAVSRSMTAEESDEKTGELQADATTVMTIARGEFCSLLLPDEVDINDVAFTSSDERIIRVDAAGRVEGRAEGDAVVTAASEDFTASCNFRVKGEKKTPEVTEVTTAYTANADILAENIKEGKTNRLYRITVNRRTNTVTVFTYDKDGKYTVPVRAMVCSCGAGGPNITPVGEYRTASSREWAALYGDETHDILYGQYVTEFNGEYLFHSVPYESQNKYALEIAEFNKLGTNASQGCVRLSVSDSYWIYKNCPLNTPVSVVDADASADPLGTPPTVEQKIYNGWDPTDPDEINPFSGKRPRILNIEDVTVKKGSDFDPMEGVLSKDICGNIITERVAVSGKVLTDKPGVYFITYSITDDFHLSRTATRIVTVK